MPTIRILADVLAYNRLTAEQRKTVSATFRVTASEALKEDRGGVEAFWMAPFEAESASNTLPYSWDVEFSMSIPEEEMARLGIALLDTFKALDFVPGGGFGVWIKTPGMFRWYEDAKD